MLIVLEKMLLLSLVHNIDAGLSIKTLEVSSTGIPVSIL